MLGIKLPVSKASCLELLTCCVFGWAQVPEFRVAYTITTDKLDTLAKRLKPKGVTMTALLAKAAGVALASHPLLYGGAAFCILYPMHVTTTISIQSNLDKWMCDKRTRFLGVGIAYHHSNGVRYPYISISGGFLGVRTISIYRALTVAWLDRTTAHTTCTYIDSCSSEYFTTDLNRYWNMICKSNAQQQCTLSSLWPTMMA